MRKYLQFMMWILVLSCTMLMAASEAKYVKMLDGLDPSSQEYRLVKAKIQDMIKYEEVNGPINVDLGYEMNRQGGDTFGDAFVIDGFPFADTGTTVGYAGDYGPYADPLNCSEGTIYSSTGGAADVVYYFTLDATGTVSVDLCNSGYDTALAIFDDAGNLLAVNDDNSDCSSFSRSAIDCELDAGSYYLVVDGYGSSEGDYDLTVDVMFGLGGCTDPAAANFNPDATYDDGSCLYDGDDCSLAIEAVEGINSATGADQWFWWTAPGDGILTISSCMDGQFEDTRFGVFADCADFTGYYSTNSLMYDDDLFSDCAYYNYASGNSMDVVAGTVYYIFWDDAWGPAPFSWELTYSPYIYGCTDPDAVNYDPNANMDDGTCDYGCTDNQLTVYMYDSYGDGWNGNVLELFDELGNLVGDATLEYGAYGEAFLCVPDGTYDVSCDGGSWPSEVSWEIYDDAGNLLLAGGAPFSGELVAGGCFDNAITVLINTGSYGSEVSWDIYDSGGNMVAGDSGYASNSEYIYDLCLADGDYAFNAYDSWGDGWNGGTFTILDNLGNTILSDGLVDGNFGSWPFSLPANAGCTDPFAINYDPGATSDDGSCEYLDGPVGLTAMPDAGFIHLEWFEPNTFINCGEGLVDALPFNDINTNEGMGDNFDVTYSDGEDYAYLFIVDSPITVDISLCSSITDYDTKLEVFSTDESCQVTSIAYSDDGPFDSCPESPAPYTPSAIEGLYLDVGAYYIVVDGFGGDVGNYEINIFESPAAQAFTPSISEIQSAEFEKAGERLTGFNYPGQPVSTTGFEYDEVVINVDNVNRVLNSYDIFRNDVLLASVDAATLMYDDYDIVELTDYCYIVQAVYDEGGSLPSNEACATYLGIMGCTDPNALNYDPDATYDDGSCTYEDDTCDGANLYYYVNDPMVFGSTLGAYDVNWYVFYTDGTNNLITASLCGSDFDTKIAVFDYCDDSIEIPESGSPDNYIAYNDDAYCDGEYTLQSEVALNDLPAGQYWVAVYGFGSNYGDYQLNITGENLIPPDPPYNVTAEGLWYEDENASAIEWCWEYACEVYDCDGICADGYLDWLADGSCDDGTYGINFNCAEFNYDEGDCGGGDCQVYDCVGACADNYLGWLGDGLCDDGTWDIDFNCAEFNYDEGDCGNREFGDQVMKPEPGSSKSYIASKMARAPITNSSFSFEDGGLQTDDVSRQNVYTLYFSYDGTDYEFETSSNCLLVYGFAPGSYVCGVVTATDENGLESVPSEEACAESGYPEECVYEAPQNLVATGMEDYVLLEWEYPGFNDPSAELGETMINPYIVDAVPYYDSGSTVGRSDDYDEVCPYSGSTSADVVYYWDAEPGDWTFDICESDYDTKIYVYDTDGILMGCNDDYCSDSSGNSYRSMLGLTILDYGPLYIIIDGYGGAEGNYNLEIYSGLPALSENNTQPEKEEDTSNMNVDRECGVTMFNIYLETAEGECPPGQFMDCTGGCFDEYYLSWIGDGYCDDGFYGIDFMCEEWNYDDGDCDDGGDASDTGDKTPVTTNMTINRSWTYIGSTSSLFYEYTMGTTGCFIVTADDNYLGLNESEPSNVACDSDSSCPCEVGDYNCDGSINVLDIVNIVSVILNPTELPECDFFYADFNGDGAINVLDIVQIVAIILNPRSDNADSATIIKSGGELRMTSNGYVGGVQMKIAHDGDFSLTLTDDALLAEYRTVDNVTTIVIVNPGSDVLFTSTGDYEIVEFLAATAEGFINTNLMAPGQFNLSAAYPNPFNPVTSLTVELPVDSYVSVQVYNVMGQMVEVLADGPMSAGYHDLTWDAGDAPSGMYFIRSIMGSEIRTQKVMLLK